MRQLAAKRGLGLLDSVRMFALANMANIDATVAIWHAKNHYDFWRPTHAIQLGDTDDNPLTQADPSWVSEHTVPPLQEYPSAHAIQCQAVARTLSAIFGTDRVSFATQSTTALPSNRVRSFTPPEHCFKGVRRVADHDRLPLPLLGEHGARMGDRVAREIVETQLLQR